MPLIASAVPNLIGGVSQQPAALRFPGQAEEQTNAMATVVEGLTKRPPTEHVAKVLDAVDIGASGVKAHTINRDVNEKYIAVLGDQSALSDDKPLKIFDIDGTAIDVVEQNQTALESGDLAYLDCEDPNTDFQLLTVNDYTFVVNKTKPTALKEAVTPVRLQESLVTVVQGNYTTMYNIQVTYNGNTRAVTKNTNNAVGPETAADIKTNIIARDLAQALTNDDPSTFGAGISVTGTVLDGDNDFLVERLGSTVYIQIRSGAAPDNFYDISIKDSVGDGNMTLVTDTVQIFTDLPVTAKHGFVTKVTGDPDSGIDDYYVKFVAHDEGDALLMAQGTWQESVAPGITYQIDPATMPHLLIRQADGKFLFTPADGGLYTVDSVEYTVPSWDDRQAGDEATNRDPSFIGLKINDIFFYKNRLGFLTDDRIVLSEAGKFFSWFRITVIQLLDSERIDVIAAHTKVSVLNHAIPFVEVLVLFSESTQFVLRAEGILTPKTVSISPTTEYSNDRGVSPVATGDSVFFSTNEGGNFATVREYRDISAQRLSFEATEVSSPIPTYITGSITKLASSNRENILAVQASGSASTLWVYKYFNNAGQRVQSSWFKFTFGSDAIIKNVDFINSTLYMLVQRTEGLFIEKINLEAGQSDADSDFLITLDRKIPNTSLSSAVYSASTGLTTLTLPYNISPGATMQVVSRATPSVEPGANYPVVSTTTNTIVVSGDHSSTPLWVGEQYTMNYTFSEVHLQQPSQRGGMTSVISGRYQLLNGTLLYADSGNFVVKVTPKYQTAYQYPFTGKIIGAGSNLIGAPSIESGIFKFPVLGKHDEITVEIENDSPLPSRLLSAEWEASYNTRNVRMG